MIETVAEFGVSLGCLVCPSAASLRRYGGWQALLHEIGHFAIAPRFLWDVPAHADAAAQGERPPVPPVHRFALGIGNDGKILSSGTTLWDPEQGRGPQVAAIAENPNPLTDWHVRAWAAWAADRLGLPTPRNLWLDSSPWADLLLSAEHGHKASGRPAGWAQRHPEIVDRWRQRASSPHNRERELEWRLADLKGVIS